MINLIANLGIDSVHLFHGNNHTHGASVKYGLDTCLSLGTVPCKSLTRNFTSTTRQFHVTLIVEGLLLFHHFSQVSLFDTAIKVQG